MRTTLLVLTISTAAQAATPTPGVETPAAFRDVAPEATVAWKSAEPADGVGRGAWWTLFDDPALDELQRRALAANQDLRAASARVEQARAAAGVARSSYWPQVAANGAIGREQVSLTTDNVAPVPLATTFRTPLIATWEIDLFGRVRHLAASARADLAATTAMFEAVTLTLSSDVAANYFTLRALDYERALVRDSITLRERAKEITAARFTSGTATELDVARADAELATTEAEFAALNARRATLQNALAVLLGVAAPGFEVAAVDAAPVGSRWGRLPVVPVGLPAALLERRPDIAAAERALEAAGERIGVAKAAFFPAISLTGAAGYASAEIDRLFTADSRAWSIGPSLYLPIFQGGRNRANLARARAVHEEAVAAYRQRVLVAFREVQDALTTLRFLEEQDRAQQRALAAARRAASLAQTRYESGLVGYFEVIDAQRTVLATERASAQLAGLRLNTGVALVKALGGGWQRTEVVATR